MRDLSVPKAEMSGLVAKLGQMSSSLSGDEQAVFAEMIECAVSQAEELQDQRAAEIVGGATSLSIYLKPISAVASLHDLQVIRNLRVGFGG